MLSRLLLVLVVALSPPVLRAQPNVVVVFTDDVPYHILSATGHPYSRTPNIDRLARDGALFGNAFVATPLCSPSRASYLTGTHPQMHGITGNEVADSGALRVFPSELQKAGYRTGFVGKWHMGNSNAVRPGFNWWAAWAGQGPYDNPPINLNGTTKTYNGYVADVVTNLAVDFINTSTSPFFLWVAHKNVHQPSIPAPRHVNIYPEAVGNISGPELTRIRCLRSVDDSVGRILQALTQRGILDRTVVIFTSDSGYARGFPHPVPGGDKRGPYDEMTRVPLLMRYPPSIQADKRIDQLVSSLDLAPTVLSYAGVAIPARMHGLDLRPLFGATAPASWRDKLYLSYFRDGQFPTYDPWRAVRTTRWKYVKYSGISAGEIPEMLFDLAADPREQINVIAQNPSIAAQLAAETDRLYRQTSIRRDWLQEDIGTVNAKGETVATLSRNPSIWTVKGSGAGIKGNADEFHFVRGNLAGNGTVTARLTSFSGSPAGAAAGVMIRGSNAANARFASVSYVNGQGVVFSQRPEPGAAVVSSIYGATALPRHLRLRRNGRILLGYISSDGANWVPVGSATIASLPTNAIAGIAVTSAADGTLVTAAFKSVSVTVP